MHFQRVKYKDIEQVQPLQINKNFKQDFQGSSPSLFVGRECYPQVNVGFLSPQFSGDTNHYDSPKLWSRGKFGISQIANMRLGLVNSRLKWDIKDVHRHDRFLDICKEIGASSKSVEVEVALKDAPKLNLNLEKEIIPFGPQGEVKLARSTSNARIDSRVDRVISDGDLKAVYAVNSLYQKGFEESFLTKLLSSGNVGMDKNRKLVPTRWSITAVDDTLGKDIIAQIKDLTIGDYQVYFGGGWGNYYLVLMFPELWSFELFEMYISYKANPWSKDGNFYSTDFEDYNGRKGYAQECSGGYYASRLSVLEKMKDNNRQNATLVLRFITPEYTIPLGVWVCREACRKSMKERCIGFGSKELMMSYVKEFAKMKFGVELGDLFSNSKLLKNVIAQRKITEY